LARIREANTVVIDRDQLASKLASARQQLERSRTQELSSLVGQSDSVNISRSVTSSSSVPSDPNETTGSTASNWVIADVADNLSSTTRLAKADSSSVDEVSISPPSSTDNSQRLLAAAPLNPDIYRPLPSIPSGETIVPGMPMLPGAGEFLPQAPAESNGYVWPTRGTFTSGYGWRWGRMHRGIDIAGPVGTPIVAAASGVVVRSGWNSGGYGNVVDIRHRDGSMTRYAHNSRLLVREGQQVNQGQSIAQMGSTGYSTGPHLHFEIHLPGNGTVNPIAYLPDR
jgi:murein DD-endopeptidase MepM/ murein hydrolase activator NlpD